MSTPAARPGAAGAAQHPDLTSAGGGAGAPTTRPGPTGATQHPELAGPGGRAAGASTPELSDPPETLGVGPEIPLGAGQSGSIRMATVLTAVSLVVLTALAAVTAVAATSIFLAVVPE